MLVTMDGLKVGAMRNEKGMSRREFAEAVGITVKTLARAESGEAVRLETAQKVAEGLGVAPKSLARPVYR